MSTIPVIPHTEATDNFETWRLTTNSTIDLIAKNNLTAITDPSVTDDDTEGYSVTSMWLNTLSKEMFTNFSSATGAADWKTDAHTEVVDPIPLILALS